MADDYDRGNTEAVIRQAFAQGAQKLIFNDPVLLRDDFGMTLRFRAGGRNLSYPPAPSVNVGGGHLKLVQHHAHHLHIRYPYEKGDTFPIPPPVPIAASSTEKSTAAIFALEAVSPDFRAYGVPPNEVSVVLRFNAPIDESSVTDTAIEWANVDTEESVPFSIRIDESSRALSLIPHQPLSENTYYQVSITGDIRDTSGQSLDAGSTDVVIDFATGLDSSYDSLEFDSDLLIVTRDDFSTAQLPMSVTYPDGAVRDVTGEVDEILLESEDGALLVAELGEGGVFDRLFNGTSIASTSLAAGIHAEAVIRADLITTPSIDRPIVPVGETLALTFDEAINLATAQLSSALSVDDANATIPANYTISNDGLTVQVSSNLMPTYVPLNLQVTIDLQDDANNELGVVTITDTFKVLGIRDGDLDTDMDGLPDVLEVQLPECLDPENSDTDGDGIGDADEDCDGDGLSNIDEIGLFTDPGNPDSDEDGVPDGVELRSAVNCNPIVPETTTVIGRIVDAGALPVSGAIASLYRQQATSDSDGVFTLFNVPSCPLRNITVAAEFDSGSTVSNGVSVVTQTVLDGTTDVGDITLREFAGTMYFAGYRMVDYNDAPGRVAVADLNDDGVLDLISGNTDVFGGNNTLSVLLGNRDGSYQNYQTYTVGQTPWHVVVEDLDGDGNLDVVATASEEAGVSVLMGNGDGTLQTEQRVAVPGSSPYSIVVDRIDGDAIPDLIVANKGSNDVAFFAGNGDGTFGEPIRTGGFTEPQRVTAALLNDDQNLDLLVADVANSSQIPDRLYVAIGNGDGTFQVPVPYTVGEDPRIRRGCRPRS